MFNNSAASIHNYKFIKMRLNISILLLFIISASEIQAENRSAKTSLKGTITDKTTNLPIYNASVYFPDLQRGTTTNVDGMYSISDLPKINATIQISCIGYKSITQRVNLSQVNELNFSMETTIIELNEMVITGQSTSSESQRTPSPIHVVTTETLEQTVSTNIINAISKQPGISEITTGGGISKPVIRGLGYNRVIVLNDGIRQEGQQWGDEHGIEIDEYSISKVELLKGPASLTYGSDAMAGVINLISDPNTPDSTISGRVSMNYQSNNGLWGGSILLNGNTRKIVWGAQYSTKSAHDYRNKYDGAVYNSRFSEDAFNAHVGINRSWGFSKLKFSAYHFTPGIVEGERDSATGKFVKPIAVNDSTSSDEIVSNSNSYFLQTPHQDIRHYKAVLNNLIILGNSALKATLGWQQNQRKEFAEILDKENYQLYFLLNTMTYDVKLDLPENKWVNLTIGTNGMGQKSENRGEEFLVPEYSLFDFGFYVIGKKSYRKLDLSGGVRYDIRNIDGKSLFLNNNEEVVAETDANATTKFRQFSSQYTGFSGSLGATYPIFTNTHAKLNISRGFRAPNIAELGANGVHEGTIRYELGNAGLKAESSTQLDLGFLLEYSHFSFEVNGFYNQIQNYIYLEKGTNRAGSDSIIDGNALFTYTSGNARLFGGEISTDFHPHKLEWIHFENTFSLVVAKQANRPDSATYLPFTPAPKWMCTLRVTKSSWGKRFSKLFANVELEYYFKKEKVYLANNTETPTPDYGLVNLNVGTDFRLGKKWSATLVASVNNLLDVAYQSHLSRLKYAPENYATGRTGVYNMGRNVSVKLIVPFDVR
jgi:iron complex outermembrane receptor protein